MTEAAGGGRAEMERRLVQRSLEDEYFRRRLLEDPRAAVEVEMGTRLPEDVRVRAVEETASSSGRRGGENPSRWHSKTATM
jgi:hypothetical protein